MLTWVEWISPLVLVHLFFCCLQLLIFDLRADDVTFLKRSSTQTSEKWFFNLNICLTWNTGRFSWVKFTRWCSLCKRLTEEERAWRRISVVNALCALPVENTWPRWLYKIGFDGAWQWWRYARQSKSADIFRLFLAMCGDVYRRKTCRYWSEHSGDCWLLKAESI